MAGSVNKIVPYFAPGAGFFFFRAVSGRTGIRFKTRRAAFDAVAMFSVRLSPLNFSQPTATICGQEPGSSSGSSKPSSHSFKKKKKHSQRSFSATHQRCVMFKALFVSVTFQGSHCFVCFFCDFCFPSSEYLQTSRRLVYLPHSPMSPVPLSQLSSSPD